MRGLKTLLLAGMIAGIPAVASAQWYVGGDSGINFGDNTKYSRFEDTGTVKGKRDAIGYTGLLQGGYAFGGSSVGTPKVELEAGYRYAGFDKLKGLGAEIKANGHTNVASIMVNGLYEFMPASNWHPFLGAGIGTAYLDYVTHPKGDNKIHGDAWKFAYQGIAGVSYDLTKHLSAKLQYRYFSTVGKTSVKWNDGFGGRETGKADFFSDHSILVGLTYKFGRSTPARVVSPAP